MTSSRPKAPERAPRRRREASGPAIPDRSTKGVDAAAAASIAERAMLDDLALGELVPEQASDFAEELLAKNDKGLSGDLYDALSARTWKLLNERRYADEARPWYEICRYVSANLAAQTRHELALRLEGVAELIKQSVDHRSAHEPLAPRKAHEEVILRLLASEKEEMLRDRLRELAGLKQANLSRVLANLATDGFIARRTEGREVYVSITLDGQEALKRSGRRALLTTTPPLRVGLRG